MQAKPFDAWFHDLANLSIRDVYASCDSDIKRLLTDKEYIDLLPAWIEDQNPSHEQIQAAFRLLSREGNEDAESTPVLKLCSEQECEPPFGGKEDCEFFENGICKAKQRKE